MKIKFDNKYLPMLYGFVAKDDPRYYLQGFHVKPHPEVGVILTATDGHSLVTIHDADGFSDGEYIFPITKPLLQAASKKTLRLGMPLQNVVVIDGIAMVTAVSDILDGLNDFDDINENAVRDLISHVEFIKPIDGNFPNGGRVFERLKTPMPVAQITLNPELFTRLIKLKSTKFSGANFCFYGNDSSIVAVMGMNREIVVMILPMRTDELDRATPPEFVNLCGHQPVATLAGSDSPTSTEEKSAA